MEKEQDMPEVSHRLRWMVSKQQSSYVKNLEIFRRECTSPFFYAKITSDSFEILSQRATGKQNEPYYERNTGITETL